MEKYLLKCDISGIQKFIFNVTSEGAAKGLKKRSVHVQNISDKYLVELTAFLGSSNVHELYNGGGNFYLKIQTDKREEEITEYINENFYKPNIINDIFAFFSFVKDQGEKTGELLNLVNKEINKAKMHRPISFELLDATPQEVGKIDIFKIPGINGHIPMDNTKRDVLEFSEIAKKSNGDSKLAALKLDVDNLGRLFRDRNENDYKNLSKELKNFFDGQLLALIKEKGMEQNIYVVFSGGDDCFLIGSWNSIFELAITLRNRFLKFQNDLKNKIKSLPKDEITFSAGIIVFQPHYPMLQVSDEVEEAINTSKRVIIEKNGKKKEKDSITVFGKTLTWDDFIKAQKLTTIFMNLINNENEKNRESKSLLQIFRLIYPQTEKKEMPKVWRLKYYLRRNVKIANEETVKSIFDEYTQALLHKYLGKNDMNPDIYLVASRWAELLNK